MADDRKIPDDELRLLELVALRIAREIVFVVQTFGKTRLLNRETMYLACPYAPDLSEPAFNHIVDMCIRAHRIVEDSEGVITYVEPPKVTIH